MKTAAQTIILAVGLACLPWQAQAGEQQATRGTISTISAAALGYGGADKFDLAFPGGTPAELVDAMTKAAGESIRGFHVNVLIPPELKNARIPPMQLRSVDARSVFMSLNMISRDGMQWIPSSSRGSAYPEVDGLPALSAPVVWVLSRSQDERKTRAFYVGHLLKKFKIDDITTAIQTTWQLGASDRVALKSELKYHQDTQLLIALAWREQLDTAAEVLAQLNLAIEPAAAAEVKGANDKKTR